MIVLKNGTSIAFLATLMLISCSRLNKSEMRKFRFALDGNVQAQLVAMNKEQARELIQNSAIARMDRQLDLEMKWTCDGGMVYTANDSVAPVTQPGSKSEGSSTTNNQVSGVDEADFIKNDDEYIYVLSNSHFQIIRAKPKASVGKVSKLKIEGNPLKLFVWGDRAVIYLGMTEPVKGIGLQDYSQSSYTRVLVLDLSNREKPEMIRTVEISGELIAARRIGNSIHTVLSKPQIYFAVESLYHATAYGLACDRTSVAEKADNLAKMNSASIRSVNPILYMPWVRDRVQGQTEFRNHLIDSMVFLGAPSGDGEAVSSLLTMHVPDRKSETIELEGVVVIGKPGPVYASMDSLYLTSSHVESETLYRGWYENISVREATTIHRFALGDGVQKKTLYRGSAAVSGRVLNQYSMDEFNGVFRIATTMGELWGQNLSNQIHLLGTIDDHFGVLSQSEPFGAHEDIRSVRFYGARGFVVTFKKTDPLFVFDLSNPLKPILTGELVIPGFSTYMHMIDDSHIVGVGFDADDRGGFAWFSGILLQIFDVGNPSNPLQKHKLILGQRGSGSAAQTDPLAFQYLKTKQLMPLPVTLCEGGHEGTPGTLSFDGLILYNVSVEKGFKELGRFPARKDIPASHSGSENVVGGYDGGCDNWWTNATSTIKRTVVINETLFAISGSWILARDLNSIGSIVAEMPLYQNE